jgi:hypothetical protein
MRHTNFQDKLSSFSIVSDSDQLPKRIYTFDLTNGIQEIAFPTVIQIGDYYKITLTTEDRDYFIFIEWGLIREIVRVGDPDVLVIGRAGDTGLQIYYKHINATDGSVIDEGYFTEIGYNYYYIQPKELTKSFFDIEDTGLVTLVVPYKIVNVSETLTTGDIYADQNFIDVGYAEFGFLGDEFSYFDYENGIWVHDDAQMIRARASDLARAIAYKYGLVWDDRTDVNWIGNFIAYLKFLLVFA